MKLTRSLRWRIQLWHGAFLFVLLVALGFAAYHYEKQQGLRRLDDELGRRLTLVFDSLPKREEGRPPPRGEDRPPPPDRPRRGPPEFRMPPEGRAMFGKDGYFIVWRGNGEVLNRSENFPEGVAMPLRHDAGKPGSMRRDRGDFREAFLFTPPGECLLVGASVRPEKRALKDYALRLAGIEALILLVGLGGGWWMTSRSLRPLGVISQTAVEISDGRLERRIDLPADDSELGQLARVLNDTFEKLEASFERQTRFTSDAAHELRTPLSVVISQAQMALRGEREPAEYREMFEATLRGARRMQALTQSLLELARIDNNGSVVERSPSDLSTLALDAIAVVRPAAEERGITLEAELSAAPCTVDAEAVTRVIINFLNNAIEHGEKDSRVRVRTSSADGRTVLSVADEGPGIAAEHLPHLFERFYRADQSRNRKTGGSGLGLAICKAIIDAHGGELTVKSAPGEGSVFSFSVPGK